MKNKESIKLLHRLVMMNRENLEECAPEGFEIKNALINAFKNFFKLDIYNDQDLEQLITYLKDEFQEDSSFSDREKMDALQLKIIWEAGFDLLTEYPLYEALEKAGFSIFKAYHRGVFIMTFHYKETTLPCIFHLQEDMGDIEYFTTYEDECSNENSERLIKSILYSLLIICRSDHYMEQILRKKN